MSQQENICERIRFLREAGVVPRCHTFGAPDPTYTIGQHSWNATNLLLLLHPDPEPVLIKAIMWHDAAERFTGDVPAPVKWNNPILGQELDRVERLILEKYDMYHDLTPYQLSWLHAVDRLELFLWCHGRLFTFQDIRFQGMFNTLLDYFERTPPPPQVKLVLDRWIPGRLRDDITGSD